jgi:glycine dehydrogenase
MSDSPVSFPPLDTFVRRHLGSSPADLEAMLGTLGLSSLDELAAKTVPGSIRLDHPLALEGLDAAREAGEQETLARLKEIAGRNQIRRSFLGMGYHATITPGVILRNVLENPGWYTQYTPYQAEISQGRLEVLLTWQTMVTDLTGMPVANASLLDEATAAAEAMGMCAGAAKKGRDRFFAEAGCHPQTLAVLATRAEGLGIELSVGERADLDPADPQLCGVLLQHPTTTGELADPRPLLSRCREHGVGTVLACDPLALILIESPGELGADIAVGSMQRFGVPMGFGGPHAAFLACRDSFTRRLPGRIIGRTRDAQGRPALRMALQTREQHIRREKATSNICTAQVLLAIMAACYAVYHGPEGLRRIARRVASMAATLGAAITHAGHTLKHNGYFDTLAIVVSAGQAAVVIERALGSGINLRRIDDATVGIALDEATTDAELATLAGLFGATLGAAAEPAVPAALSRSTPYLTHEVFHQAHTEHEMLRWLRRMEARDLSLGQSMIPLGSCTMKLNATSEMIPVTWSELGGLHPFAPADQARGYAQIFRDLESWLAEITGFAATSLQPNAGAQGEYAGLMVIRGWHHSRGDHHRTVCLIPVSAHGTNPASAVMAGFDVVAVACKDDGDIDIDDLRAKAVAHADRLGAMMVTYPSTHGVFEEGIREMIEIVHQHGGQVYLDGANMNAQVGLCRPGDYGADVCHLNLHKTFCIPHGGGGPGVGPICVAAHLAPFLPGHPLAELGRPQAIGPVSAAPWGSAGILAIPWMYIAMMGAAGLRQASLVAILNANYMAKRLEGAYEILYRGRSGFVAHEFILDLRPFRKSADIGPVDVAKRLMDYGFHAPTMSWPVTGTLMLEPTESESRAELDRYCDALLAIREEIAKVERGEWPREDNPLVNAPHSPWAVMGSSWSHPYPQQVAAFPAPWVWAGKFWPSVGRVDDAYGDRNLVCTCGPVDEYVSE